MRKTILLAGLVSGLFYGCNTPRIVERHYNEYRATHREEFAGDCSESFPVVPEYIAGRPDTIQGPERIIKGDSIPCPDPVPGSAGKTVYVNCPDVVIPGGKTITIRDTMKVADKAREEFLRLQAKRLQEERDQEHAARIQSEAERDEWEGKAKFRFWAIFGIIVLIAAAFLFRLYSHIRK